MKSLPRFLFVYALVCASLLPQTHAQNLPVSLGFTIEGSFVNGTAESSDSILLADNNLTNGYRSGFDLTDAPDALKSSGPQGSAAFQWGVASSNSNYAHSSALWFQPLAVSGISPGQSFDLGYLFFRNGTIKNSTGATWVDLALNLAFQQPLGLDPVSVVFGSDLINTVNNSNSNDSADIVTLTDRAAPLNFTDAEGNQYFLELSFAIDQDTLDGTLSTANQFRVFEGGQGRATLVGRFTTTPFQPIPEPSSTVIGLFGTLLLIRRKR